MNGNAEAVITPTLNGGDGGWGRLYPLGRSLGRKMLPIQGKHRALAGI